MIDPYKVLGLEKNATIEEINAAYKKAARWAHPDGGGSAEEFDEIRQAHLILLDPKKRRRFDRDGIVDNNNPDNTTATALQRITMFFVRSVQATINAPQNLHLNQLDLIQGANSFFDLEIQNHHKQIFELETQVKQFEKALKRLKTKRDRNVIAELVNHHVSELKSGILAQKREIEIFEEAKLIIKDYTFEQEQGVWLGGFIH